LTGLARRESNWLILALVQCVGPLSPDSAGLGIEPATLLRLIGMSERTALRRKTEGYLKPDDADRVPDIGRIFERATRVLFERATRVLDDEERARWMA
jgi:hypothetical protein